MDVFFGYVIQYKDSKRVKLKIQWFNKGQNGTQFPLFISQRLTLTPEKWAEFKPYYPEKLDYHYHG